MKTVHKFCYACSFGGIVIFLIGEALRIPQTHVIVNIGFGMAIAGSVIFMLTPERK